MPSRASKNPRARAAAFVLASALALPLLTLAAPACKKSEPKTATTPAATTPGAPAGAAAPSSPAAPTAQTPAAAPSAPGKGSGPTSAEPLPPGALTIFQRLDAEARARPQGTLRAETVLDAIDKMSGLTKRQQYMGITVGAAYCAGGNTKSGLAISVCEYTSPEAAARGRALLETRFRTVRKELYVNGSTLLNIGLTGAAAPSADETKKIAETFASLK